MTVRLPKRQRFALGAGLAVLGVFALAGGFFAGIGRAQSTEEPTPDIPSESETATSSPSPTATPTRATFLPGPPPTPQPYVPLKSPPERPFGLIEADPYRVYTGDGDCLNLRPAPGMLFGGDPRTCVPEGFLLWLFGPAVEVDGMAWRYALGEGWVATQYLQPAPGAVRGMGPFDSVTVGQQAGEGGMFARITESGEASEFPWIPFGWGGLGARVPSVTPDGRWLAYTDWNTGHGSAMVLVNSESRLEQRFPGLTEIGWNRLGYLLVRDDAKETLAWLTPENPVLHEIPNTYRIWGSWAPGGQSVIASVDGNTIVHVTLDGTRTDLVVDLEENAYFGELSLSPDGTKVLSASFLGDIRIIDLATGQISVLARAPQFEGTGKCGGSTGKLSAWLDNDTVVWHESYAPRGQNGITIATVSGGIQRVIPFFNIQDLKVVAPGLISFSTWDWFEGSPSLIATWLLDAETGEGRPVTSGGYGVWHPAQIP